MKKCKVFYIKIKDAFGIVYLRSFDSESCDFTTSLYPKHALSFNKEIEAARFCNEFSKKLPFGFTFYYEPDFILTH